VAALSANQQPGRVKPPRLPFGMKTLLFLPAALLMSSCTVGPMITASGVSLGGTVFTKSDAHYAKYDGPLGKIEYGTIKGDETVIPTKAINAYTIGEVVRSATSAFRTSESTTRILAKEKTAQQAAQNATEIEKLKILNPVEEIVVPP